MKKSSRPKEDMPPISVTRAEAKNWADMGNKLVGTNTRNKKIVEVPTGSVFNQRGDRFYQTKSPMMQDSPLSSMPKSGKGVGTRKMTKGKLTKGKTIDTTRQDPLGIGDINNVSAYQRAAANTSSKNVMRDQNRTASDVVRRVGIPDVVVNGKNLGLQQGAARMVSDVLAGGKSRQTGSVVTLTQNNKPKTSESKFNPQNPGAKGASARKSSAATSLAKGQGAYINGKPASAELTKMMRPRKKV